MYKNLYSFVSTDYIGLLFETSIIFFLVFNVDTFISPGIINVCWIYVILRSRFCFIIFFYRNEDISPRNGIYPNQSNLSRLISPISKVAKLFLCSTFIILIEKDRSCSCNQSPLKNGKGDFGSRPLIEAVEISPEGFYPRAFRRLFAKWYIRYFRTLSNFSEFSDHGDIDGAFHRRGLVDSKGKLHLRIDFRRGSNWVTSSANATLCKL